MNSNILVVDDRFQEQFRAEGFEVLTPMEYILLNGKYLKNKKKVYNLSSSLGYQEKGYYVSLLALARGDKVFPRPRMIQDLKDKKVQKFISEEMSQVVQTKLHKIKSESFELSIYFGKNLTPHYDKLAWEFYRLIQAPMFRVFLEKKDIWIVSKVRILTLPEIIPSHFEFLLQAAKHFLIGNKQSNKIKSKTKYDLAILINEDEEIPPSDKKALKCFEKAFKEVGFKVNFIQNKDHPNIGMFDALFIRETTNVTHHTYRLARNGEMERLVVIDDPDSIVKCTNKVFLEQLLDNLEIPRPKTWIYDIKAYQAKAPKLNFPCVVKQPDSAFSQGVYKVHSLSDLNDLSEKLFKMTDLLIIQEYIPTDYDWRIGVLNGEVIYACKYFMAKDHWQIINNVNGKLEEGGFECVDPKFADGIVIKTALKATNAIGKGLYGVDLKQKGDQVYLIEVNDNPSIEYGVEDQFSGQELYNKIAKYFLNECHKKRGINVKKV